MSSVLLPITSHAGLCARLQVQGGFYPNQVDTIVRTVLEQVWLDPAQRAQAAVAAIRGAVSVR